MDTSPLERRLFSGQVGDLAEAALIASGVENEAELRGYLDKLDALRRRMEADISLEASAAGLRRLLDWLWRSKPRRYRQGGSFRLSDVLEAQLDTHSTVVGNCLGLTILYNSLAHRLGVRMKAVYLEDFQGFPHVFSMYRDGDTVTDIEHVFPGGFGYQGHRNNPLRVEWTDQELMADVYHSRGSLMFEAYRFEEAAGLYDKALYLNPKYIKARLNKGLALLQMGRNEEAARLLGETG